MAEIKAMQALTRRIEILEMTAKPNIDTKAQEIIDHLIKSMSIDELKHFISTAEKHGENSIEFIELRKALFLEHLQTDIELQKKVKLYERQRTCKRL